MTILKKACKCYLCGNALNVGDNATFHKKVIGHASVVRGSTFVRWQVQCASGCGERLLQQQQAKQAAAEQQEAQRVIDGMRSGSLFGAGGPVYAEDLIVKMISHYASKGITVV